MDYFVYILQSLKDNRFYIGATSDVAARLAFHNAGFQRSTKNRIPFQLVYVERFSNKQAALLRERQIKAFKGGAAFQSLLKGM
ncbi:GIY-YIG nuclease family protein [Flaviaesturariibacter aridisoli]|uniref:GIY-YIG nuclease family protein n=1 Tax=Flaviaesturariibacter aridisoli TaxID=2545761 RepID=UPI0014046419|nr:GIY-YIG nuclease family protein [Flaviaesturariibacter aridisoli]